MEVTYFTKKEHIIGTMICIAIISLVVLVWWIYPNISDLISHKTNKIVTTSNINKNQKCEWGTKGDSCLTAGDWLNWCMSMPMNNVTDDPLHWCTRLMSQDPQPKYHPDIIFKNNKGIDNGRIICEDKMYVYQNYSISCDEKSIIGYIPENLRGDYHPTISEIGK